MGYRQVYFRIKSAYEAYGGWADDHAAEQFRDETRSLFQESGWTLHPGGNGVCDTVTKGKQELYLHPMNFSGVIQEESIPELEALMCGTHSFRCYATDRYEEYLDMSNDEYLELLESKREEIVSRLLEVCKTKRRNLFKTGSVAGSVADHFSVHRLCDKQNMNGLGNRFVNEVMEQLIAEGRLITAHTRQGEGVRTATAKELGEQAHKPTEQTGGQMSMTM